MNLVWTVIIFVAVLAVLELTLRFAYLTGQRGLKGWQLWQTLFFKRIDHKKHRFAAHAKSLGLPLEEVYKSIALAGGVSVEEVEQAYAGDNSMENLGYRPFIGFRPRSWQNLSYAELNELGGQGTFTHFRKQPGVKRILALGGSTAYGLGQTSPAANWAHKLEEELNTWEKERGSSQKWEVLNMAYPGATSTSELNLLNIYGKLLAPNYVVQLSGFNDLWFFLKWKKMYSFFSYENVYAALNRTSAADRLRGFAVPVYLAALLRKLGLRGAPSTKDSGAHQVYTVW